MKLVRQAGAKTNDLAGDGSTTSVVLAQGLIAEGVKVQTMIRIFISSGLRGRLNQVAKKFSFSMTYPLKEYLYVFA